MAAGHAILAAAGGGLMRLDGTVLKYGRADEGFTLDGLVAFGGRAAEKAARAALD